MTEVCSRAPEDQADTSPFVQRSQSGINIGSLVTWYESPLLFSARLASQLQSIWPDIKATQNSAKPV